MTVQYNSSRRDLAAWYWYSLRHNRTHRWRWVLIVLLVGLLVFAARRQAGVSLLAATVLALLAAAAAAAFLALYPQMHFKPQQRTLRIGPDGMSTTIGSRSRSYIWSVVRTVDDAGDFVAIALQNGNAFVVPDRAFATEAERMQFIAECRNYKAATGNQPPN